MKNTFFKLTYKDTHILSAINNLQNIINEVTSHGIKITCIDDLFNKDIMQNYKLYVNYTEEV